MTKCDLIPMEFNVVVELDPIEQKTAGGIYIPHSKVDRDKLEAEEGTLVAVSPHAFTYAEWPEGARMPQVGDRVLIARFNGVLRDRGGKSLKIVKDKDIIAVVETAPSPQMLPGGIAECLLDLSEKHGDHGMIPATTLA